MFEKLKRFWFLAGFFSLFGARMGPDNVAEEQKRFEAATKYFNGLPFGFIFVPASGRIGDNTFISLSKMRGPSGLARQLSDLMSDAALKHMRIAISGPSSAKTARVILDAVTPLQGKNLQGLKVLFIGDTLYQAQTRAAIEGIGALYYFNELVDGSA